MLLSVLLATSRGWCANAVPFDIQAGPASESLIEFGHQAGLEVYFPFDDVTGINTPAVRGTLDPFVALTRLLVRSGLIFRRVTDRALIIYRDEIQVKKPPSGTWRGAIAWVHRQWRKLTTSPRPAVGSEEIVISGESGSHDLVRPAGSQRVRITSEDIARSGSSAAAELLSALPYNFRGGANEDTTFGREAKSNTAFGSGANLFGLGSRATLILVNGQRLAPSGSAGLFVDLSAIPLNAVDHVEWVDDSAAAFYGADAVAGVINYVLRKNEHSIESTGSFGHLVHGDLGQRVLSQTVGHAWGTGSGFIAFELYERDALFAAQRAPATNDFIPWGRPNLGTIAGNADTIVDTVGHGWGFLPRQERVSAYANLTGQAGDDAPVQLNALFSRRDFDLQAPGITARLNGPGDDPHGVLPDSHGGAPNGGDAVMVEQGSGRDLAPARSNGRVDTGQFVLGYANRHHQAWSVDGDIGYAFENQHGAEVALDPMRSAGHVRYHSSLTYGTLKASAPLFALWSSDAALSVGFGYCLQAFTSEMEPAESVAAPEVNRKRRVVSVFAELNIPLWTGRIPGAPQEPLMLSLGGRHERYTDVGRVFAPQVGIAFRPGTGFSLFGSWVRLFRAPSLADVTESNNFSGLYTLEDPRSATGYTTALVWGGSNANLRPETARSVSFGTAYSPQSIANLQMALSYFDFVFNHRIQETSGLPLDALSDPKYAWWVTRGISPTQQAAVCSRSFYNGIQSECATANVGALVDIRLHNSQTLKTKGILFSTHYRFDLPLGQMTFGLNSTYVLRYALANAPTDPLQDLRNTPHNPPGFKSRGSLTWNDRDVWISSFVNYQQGYRDPQTGRAVSSWTTLDATLGVTLSESGDHSGRTQIVVRGSNLFNRDPPLLIDYVGRGYDPENADPYGRRVTLTLQRRW